MGRNLDVEYKMRMTQDLKDKIVASAKELNRSMNADIVDRLEKSFNVDTSEIEDFIVFIENEITEISSKEANKLLLHFFKQWLAFKKSH